MSSILRALKKLDEDSVSRENQPGEQKVKMKHMVHRPTKTSRVVTRVLFVSVVFLLVVTAVLIRGWYPRRAKEQPPQPVVEHTPPPGKSLQVQPGEERPPQPVGERPVTPESKLRQSVERLEKRMEKVPPLKTGENKGLVKSTPKPGIKLEGILWSQEAARRLALINDRYFKEGDKIEGASITEIGKKEVTFQLGDEKWTIRLKK